MPAEPPDRTSAWYDTAAVGAMAITFVLSLARMLSGLAANEPFGADMTLALIFTLLTGGVLASELAFRVRRRRARPE